MKYKKKPNYVCFLSDDIFSISIRCVLTHSRHTRAKVYTRTAHTSTKIIAFYIKTKHWFFTVAYSWSEGLIASHLVSEKLWIPLKDAFRRFTEIFDISLSDQDREVLSEMTMCFESSDFFSLILLSWIYNVPISLSSQEPSLFRNAKLWYIRWKEYHKSCNISIPNWFILSEVDTLGFCEWIKKCRCVVYFS